MPDVPVDEPTCPEGPLTVREYVAALRALRDWSGLTYRQLAAKAEAAGEVLPSSTLAAALHRDTLPRPELVAALVRAVGLDETAVTRWVAARERARETALDAGPVPDPGAVTPDGAETGGGGSAPPPGRPRPRWRAAVAVAALVALALAVALVVVLDRDQEPPGGAGASAVPRLPAKGWYQMRPQHVAEALCVGEGRERNKRTVRPLAVQRPCGTVVPRTYLERISEGVYQIQWHREGMTTGCLTVDQAYTVSQALLAPTVCEGAAHQRFVLEPGKRGDSGVPLFRLRPLHSNLCVGVLGGAADTDVGAEIAQKDCDGGADQDFAFVPETG
ncbi:XRE family transcriptional regulator [Streptomyces sp. NPDC057638]|uniref:XRE family transcriptional regulator n=1 Tax=Streptomyces sp. NPDC057638 TaxID=3346190 RepID=UPI00368E2466